MNTYPFTGEIKMEKVIKNGKEVIEWEPIPLQSDRLNVDPDKKLLINMKQPEAHISFGWSNQSDMWAHIDKDMNVTHLDMELCAKGPHNAYTALAMAIWNKAVQEEREACAKVCDVLAVHPEYASDITKVAAQAIRARGEK